MVKSTPTTNFSEAKYGVNYKSDNRMRRFLPLLCIVYLLFSCGSDDIPEPVETKPNYFPDTIGSRWVYRSVDEQEWTREITDRKDIQNNNYQTFNYTPTDLETDFEILKPTYFRVTQNNIFFDVSDKINQYIQTELPKSVQDDFAGLDVKVVIEEISSPDLVFLHLPLTPDFNWEAFDIEIQGNLILQDLTLLHIPFEVMINIEAEVLGVGLTETPAGNFEDTYQIEYQIETTHTVFSEEDSAIQTHIIWFTPHVGIVKIKDNKGVSELIDYTLK